MGVFLIQQISQGRLQVEVYDLSQARPVEGARVVISSNQGETLYDLLTDISGQSEIVFLNTPPLAYSQSIDEPQPYSEYNIEISKENFELQNIMGVQIFPDTLSLQRVQLSPLVGEETQEDIQIPPPTLWGDYPEKIPEDEVKTLPDETGFVVLDRVVIPEYIVVHDGDPNDATAPNYYIPFKEYIKNVASSEIYSTWPPEAIRANVLAIISFTLNRVFTEWYRNMGKNFTITSSTAYDHAFVYGRNIYEDINRIVDEIFTTYVTRPGIRQPLFTQYCDGERSSCPGWMTQWGAKYLADEGYTALEILRYYYGDDIYLDQAERVSGIPVSFPGENLSIGSQGEDVRIIQNQLNAISNNYPAINSVRVDGIFGEGTAEAVRTFQGIFNLPETGIVDFPTWYEISEIYVATQRLAELV